MGIAKCNIATLVLERLSEALWGVKCQDNSNAIVENYIEYLNCPDVDLEVCYKSEVPCINNPVIHNCNLHVTGISFALHPSNGVDIVFDLGVGDIYGALEPISYQWIFDTDVFDAVGGTTNPTIQLAVKPGKVVELLVTSIAVEISDANGCVDTKECFYTPGGMQCADNYVPCSNPVGLNVDTIYVECSRPSDLIVTSN